MNLLDWLLHRRPLDSPMAALIDRNQAVLDKAQAELEKHEKLMLAQSYAEADQVLAAVVRRHKVAVK